MRRVNDPPLWVAAGAAYPRSEWIERRFTWTDNFGRVYEAFRRRGEDLVLVPREACPPSKDDRRSFGVPIKVDLTCEPRDYQVEPIRQCLELLEKGRSHVVQASTGFGKTYLGAAAIKHLEKKTLVIVPKAHLIEQWSRELEHFLGIPRSRIGLIRRSTIDVEGKDVVLATLHTMAKDDGRVPDRVARQFGLMVIDEVHRVAADEFSTSCFVVPAMYRLGLSATPDRSDGRLDLINAHCGPVGVTYQNVPMKPKVLVIETGWRVPRDRWGEQISHKPNKDGHVLNMIARNAARNALVTHCIGEVYEGGDRTLVVAAHRRAHLEELASLAQHRLKIPSGDIGFFVGGKTRGALDKAAKAKVIFATWEMMEGTDCDWWDTCILASPRSNVKQAVGRVLREKKGKKQPVVIDLVDSDSWVYAKYADRRARYYATSEVDAEVVDLETPEV